MPSHFQSIIYKLPWAIRHRRANLALCPICLAGFDRPRWFWMDFLSSTRYFLLVDQSKRQKFHGTSVLFHGLYICLCVCVCMCIGVCVCVCGEWKVKFIFLSIPKKNFETTPHEWNISFLFFIGRADVTPGLFAIIEKPNANQSTKAFNICP